ncbi:MAG: hypothetical protein Crog4KO_21220 [Crocinitomicaceae bacterium]
MHKIVIKNAKTNNLKGISLEIPHHKFITVTGVSGSGKSSLAFDVIAREGQRRYFETMSGFARQFLGKLNQPEVDSIEGLSPVIAIAQKTTSSNARSTVGTMSDLYDLLRLIYARFGETENDIQLSRSLFSFNSEIGQCQQCHGIGQEEKIDLRKLVSDPSRTLREGALAPTLPTGYIMYSQVTIDVLNQVCEAEGFDVDIPWNELTEQQRDVILYGSDKIKVPFGKHSIESRLKWSGIKAKPREEGFYKGMMPIMSDILRRDRNANILKYVSSVTCGACNGRRLNPEALKVQLNNQGIATIATWEIHELSNWISKGTWPAEAASIIQKLREKIELLKDLGLGHLRIDQSADNLSASEAQRIRVINQLTAPLSDVLYVLDEPSIGLHPEENQRMIAHLKQLVEKGNTVMVVEHDLDTIRHSDWIIDIGPGAGEKGGNLIFNGSIDDFLGADLESPTQKALFKEISAVIPEKKFKDQIELKGCTYGNLKNIDVDFQIGHVNVVSGKSGSGTKELVLETLKPLVETSINKAMTEALEVRAIKTKNTDAFDKCIFVDQSPIGRTPRSNPATYLGISDAIRDLFASLPDAKEAGFTKSRFSFNNKGGRCETCQGAGKIQIGMHFLGNIDLRCGTCGGKRFNDPTLAVKFNELSIAEVYQLSVNEALEFFSDSSNKIEKRIRKGLIVLSEIGLGYLKLGQASTTLSGGEAQRIKIANQLQKKSSGRSLFILMEPSIGLHDSDIETLIKMLQRIQREGNTIICVEQDARIVASSHWHIKLGPDGGKNGGELIYQGLPIVSIEQSTSALLDPQCSASFSSNPFNQSNKSNISLHNVSTNGLKNIDVSIPKQQITVVTGVSGSGKSSLVYDTLFAEASARFSESLSTYSRSLVQQNSTAVMDSFEGMTPSIALPRRNRQSNKRSTVGTITGIYDHFRLLFARLTSSDASDISAQHFSFNHHLGACETCKGMGVVETCNPDEVIAHPKKSLFEGALSENRALKYYSNPDGQFMATLQTIFDEEGWELNQPWNQFSLKQQDIILNGTGDREWEVTWNYRNKSRSGTQELKISWLGFCGFINDEFERKRQNKNIQTLEDMLHDVACPSCHGTRLKPELLDTRFQDLNIAEWTELSISEMQSKIERALAESSQLEQSNKQTVALANRVLPAISKQLEELDSLGLSYLQLNRSVRTLSGGEYQRVLLAGQMAANLHGVTYIMDEPTAGLDPEQVVSLEKLLRRIVDNGNTVVVVEHDPAFIKSADYLIEMGPGAGNKGGQIVFQGRRKELESRKDTLSYELIHGLSSFPKIKGKGGAQFKIKGAYANNLKNIDVGIELNALTMISGVSGSGKSSLMRDVLFASIQKGRPVGCKSIENWEELNTLETIFIDQKPVSLKRNVTPASYLRILNHIQTLFAKTEQAKSLGFKKADFSYLSKNGKCPTCQGNGKIRTSLDFMSDVWTDCDTCYGKRYNQSIEKVLWQEFSIGGILELSAEQALKIYPDEKFSAILKFMCDIGLGHLSLGQPANTLSGGEAQRLKLIKSMTTKSEQPRLLLLDEPSIGLHQKDLGKLISIFQQIIDGGDTIVCIEHNEQLIGTSSHQIKLGPGSGDAGGMLLNP